MSPELESYTPMLSSRGVMVRPTSALSNLHSLGYTCRILCAGLMLVPGTSRVPFLCWTRHMCLACSYPADTKILSVFLLIRRTRVGDEMSLFGGGSQVDPRSPAMQSIPAGEDDMSEMSAVKSPALVQADADSNMRIPPWPDDLKSTISTLARILAESDGGGNQIVCTRAQFGLQADPAWANMVVRGKIVRVEPWQAQRDIENGDEVKGAIALVGRGGCQFTDKARRCQEAGAAAVVIVNHSDVLFNVLGQMHDMKLPVGKLRQLSAVLRFFCDARAYTASTDTCLLTSFLPLSILPSICRAVSITKRDADTLRDGTMVAVQWGEGLAPVTTAEDDKPWNFKMTSQVGFASADAHLPVVV